jgi:hypothetical protein
MHSASLVTKRALLSAFAFRRGAFGFSTPAHSASIWANSPDMSKTSRERSAASDGQHRETRFLTCTTMHFDPENLRSRDVAARIVQLRCMR